MYFSLELQSFSRSVEQFFLTVGQNNFGKKNTISFSQKTPLSTKDLMVLNQRSMLVAKYQDATEIEKDANAADEQDNLVIVTSRTISDSESKK